MEKTPMRTTDPSFQAGPQKVKWIDGLRGVASFLVILTHLSRAFDPALFSTRDDETAPIRFLQLPFFRIPPQGRIGVVIFSFVTGYVCALKPIRQMREGNQTGALSTVANPPSVVFHVCSSPLPFVTVIAWLLAQLGAFEIAKHSGSVWLDWSSPGRKDFVDSIVSLWWNLINTWISGKNEYDDHQWTLLQLVKGAFLVYVALSAVAFMQTRYRMMTAALMIVYYYCCGEPNFGMQFFFGMLLCDISQDTEIQSYIAKRRWMTTILPSILIPFGLYICSYPSERAEWASWSRPFLTVRQIIIPKNLPYGDGSIAWMYTGIGVDFIAVGLQLSPLARDVLSNRFFSGSARNSFAVYLTHGTMLRVVLVRMLYGNSIPQNTEVHNENGDIVPPEPLHIVSVPWRFILVPIWFACVYYVAFLWTNYVDSWAARVTKALETHVFVEEEGQGSGERARDLRLP